MLFRSCAVRFEKGSGRDRAGHWLWRDATGYVNDFRKAEAEREGKRGLWTERKTARKLQPGPVVVNGARGGKRRSPAAAYGLAAHDGLKPELQTAEVAS